MVFLDANFKTEFRLKLQTYELRKIKVAVSECLQTTPVGLRCPATLKALSVIQSVSRFVCGGGEG